MTDNHQHGSPVSAPAPESLPEQSELGDEVLDPAQMLALLERQQREYAFSYVRPVVWLYSIWGVAWLVGFILLWLGWSVDWMPLPVAGAVFAVLIIGSIVTSAIVGTRIGRGIQGASNFSGVVYGSSWSALGIALAAVGMGLISQGMSQELASVYFPSAYALMAGIMYLFGAALWNERGQLEVGIALLVLGSIAAFVPAPHNNLVMALGGVAFLIAALRVVAKMRRLRRADGRDSSRSGTGMQQ